MPDRHSQLLALGPELWKEARLSGHGVNESYLCVHRVLSVAFREDLGDMPDSGLREHLSRLLQQHLHTAG